MHIAAIVSLFVLIVTFASSLVWRSDPFSPARVFIVTWSIAIGLADLNLSGFQSQWSTFSWIVLLSGVFSLLLGIFIQFVLHMDEPILDIGAVRYRLAHLEINERRFFAAIVIVWFLYLFSFWVEDIIVGGLPIFSAFPERARVDYGVFGWSLIVDLMPTILFLCIEYLVLVQFKLFKKAVVVFVFITTALSFLTLLQRFSFVIWAFTALCFLFYASRFVRLRNLLLSGAVFGGVFSYIMSFRLAKFVENYLYVTSKMHFSVKYAAFTEPYMYIVMNLENLARSVEKLNRFTYGYYTGDFLMALTGLKHWMADYFGLVERPFLISGYNTYSFFWPYYHDLGIIGIVLFPLVIGFIIGSIYFRLRRRPTLLGAAMYANAFAFLLISFFTNILTSLAVVSNIVLLGAIQVFITRRAASSES
jgi:oligosaccharide repeat unit polymerase